MRKQIWKRGEYETEEGLCPTGEPMARIFAEARYQGGDGPWAEKAPVGEDCRGSGDGVPGPVRYPGGGTDPKWMVY